MAKRLSKSNNNRVISGVCGGVAEYFNIDPTIVRLAWVVFLFMGGSGVLAYIIAAIVMPSAPYSYTPYNSFDQNQGNWQNNSQGNWQQGNQQDSQGNWQQGNQQDQQNNHQGNGQQW